MKIRHWHDTFHDKFLTSKHNVPYKVQLKEIIRLTFATKIAKKECHWNTAFIMSRIVDTACIAIAFPYRSDRKSRSDVFALGERGATGPDTIRGRRYQAAIINLLTHKSSGTLRGFVETCKIHRRPVSLSRTWKLLGILPWNLRRYSRAPLCFGINGI